jgi:integrase/recombinase XerD
MTPLRQRMLDDLQLRGFSPRTREAYVRAVRQLAAHFHRPPDQLGEDQLREYFLYLTQVKHFARASFTIALCGIKFFYERTLSREWKVFDLVRPPREKKLPAVLSRDEVRRILGSVRLPVYRACLTTIYVCGLRLQEGTQVQVADVDSGRGLLQVHGKGRRDRYVPLPVDALTMLREHWRTHRSAQWLFPGPVRQGTRYFVLCQGQILQEDPCARRSMSDYGFYVIYAHAPSTGAGWPYDPSGVEDLVAPRIGRAAVLVRDDPLG